MQHPVYLEFVNAQEGLDNAPLVQIPTPRMGLFGGKKTSLDDVADGATVTVPHSPPNLNRGLLILRDIGGIDFDNVDDPNTAHLSIIRSNQANRNTTHDRNDQPERTRTDGHYANTQGTAIPPSDKTTA